MAPSHARQRTRAFKTMAFQARRLDRIGHRTRRRIAGLLAISALVTAASGCAPHAFVRTDGPDQVGGVSADLVSQSCGHQGDPGCSYMEVPGVGRADPSYQLWTVQHHLRTASL